MNKGLLGIILAVVLGAMVLIMFGQKGKPPTRPVATALSGQTQANATAGAVRNATQNASQTAPQSVAQNAGAQRPTAQVPPAAARPANMTAAAPAGAVSTAPPATAAPTSVPPPLPKVDPPVSTPPAAASKPAASSPAPASAPSSAQAGKPVESAPAAKPAAKPETPKPAAAAAITPAKGPHTLKNIGLHFKGKAIVLRIESDNAFIGKTFVLPGPDRMVVDLGGEWNNLKAPSIPSNNLVKGVRIGKQSGGPRLVLDLARPPKTHDAARPSPTIMEITIE